MKKIMLTLSCTLIFAGCGNPNNVKPMEISSLEYAGHNCGQIGGLLIRNAREYYPAAERYTNNPMGLSGVMATGGVVGFGLSGTAQMTNEERVAFLKGQRITLRETAATKHCDLTEFDAYIAERERLRAEQRAREAEMRESGNLRR